MEGERFALLKPTGTHVKHYEVASQEFADVLAKMHQLVDVDLAGLEKHSKPPVRHGHRDGFRTGASNKLEVANCDLKIESADIWSALFHLLPLWLCGSVVSDYAASSPTASNPFALFTSSCS